MSIRLRLASWCAAIFSALFIGLEVFIYSVHTGAHYRDTDTTLSAVTSHYQGEIERRLESGTPLSASLVAAIDTEGQQLVGSELTVYDVEGGVVLGRSFPGAAPILSPGDSSPHGPATYLAIDTARGRVRVHTMSLTYDSQTVGYVQTSVSLANLDRSISRFRLLLIGTAVGGLVIAIAGSLATAARALRPIADVTDTARAIAVSHGFGRRLDPIAQHDEVGELTRTFNEMLSSLDEAHQAQRRFVDDAAHELRAPLTSIIGNLDLLERASDLPVSEQQAIVTDVRAEAERLARLVSELLILARADSGQPLVLEMVELDRVVLDVVRRALPMTGGVGLDIAELVPTVVRGDADRLHQLLVILVENALRYTSSSGSVTVAMSRRDGEAVLSVRDTGIGIDVADLPNIFDRFFRADPARSRVGGGSGLGLTIAKWIAEAHEGRIEVESAPGRGSTFTVTLPSADERVDQVRRG